MYIISGSAYMHFNHEWVEKSFVSKLLCLWSCRKTRHYQSTLSMPFVIFFVISPKTLTWEQGRLLTRPSAVLLPINMLCELYWRTLFYYRILSVQFSYSQPYQWPAVMSFSQSTMCIYFTMVEYKSLRKFQLEIMRIPIAAKNLVQVQIFDRPRPNDWPVTLLTQSPCP